jgi:hypothetical protein
MTTAPSPEIVVLLKLSAASCAAQKVRAAAGSRNRDDGLGVRS